MTKTAKRDMVSIPKLINSPLEIEQPLTGVGTVFSFVNKGTHSFGFISVSPKPSTIPKVNNTPLGEDSRIYFRASEYKDKKIANLAEIVGYEVDFLYSSDKQGRVCAVNIQLTKSMKMVLGASNSQEAVLSSSTPPSLRLVNVTISVESNNRQNTFTQNNIATTGTRANVAWRSVPISDLRKHPLYIPLEEPENVQVKSCRDFSRFRQDSWQWYDLHRGRLTTSKASTCLGFYEERGAEILSVPSSRIGHGSVVQAWQEMLESPLTDWTALQNQPHSFKSNHANKGLTKSNDSKKSKCPWVFYDNGLHESNACYVYMPDSNGVVDGEASDSCGQRAVTATDSMSARLSWGSYQEATAVLVAINYFAQLGTGSRVAECGLLPFEAIDPSIEPLVAEWALRGSTPLLGASPDGLIRHPDGTVEVLEVKCMSPFVKAPPSSFRRSAKKGINSKRGGSASSGSRSHMTLRCGPTPDFLGSWHMPQLQLEILCAGPECTGAVVVSLSALDGATIYRVKRDNQYIRIMLCLLQSFYKQFCETKTSPPPDFAKCFVNLSIGSFYEQTVRMARNAEVITRIPQEQVQRSPCNTQFFV